MKQSNLFSFLQKRQQQKGEGSNLSPLASPSRANQQGAGVSVGSSQSSSSSFSIVGRSQLAPSTPPQRSPSSQPETSSHVSPFFQHTVTKRAKGGSDTQTIVKKGKVENPTHESDDEDDVFVIHNKKNGAKVAKRTIRDSSEEEVIVEKRKSPSKPPSIPPVQGSTTKAVSSSKTVPKKAASKKGASLQKGKNPDSDSESDSEPEKPTGIRPTRCSPGRKQGNIKYTPLESQWLSIKKNYPDTMLPIQVGYKYHFYEKDAEIAAKILNIVAFEGKHFLTASVPDIKLQFHLSRLVQAGYRVGVIRQTETRALKEAGDNRTKPFEREMTDLVTPSTMISSDKDLESSTNALLCLTESLKGSSDQKVEISLITVRLSTGDIIYDTFTDDFSRSQLETRITQLQPIELLVPKSLSGHTRKVLNALLEHYPAATRRAVRIESVADEAYEPNKAHSTVSAFLTDHDTKDFQKLVDLPKPLVSCIAVLLRHLREFRLMDVFRLTSNVLPFMAQNHLHLNGTTLKNLEILTNIQGSERGSLFWVLDQTVTGFGRRLMKKWISQPLADPKEIQLRLNAVETLAFTCPPSVCALYETLATIKQDLDRSLCRIYYAKCTPQEFVTTLQAFSKIFKVLPTAQILKSEANESVLLHDVVTDIPNELARIDQYLKSISIDAAATGDKANLFTSEKRFPKVAKLKKDIQQVKDSLNQHLTQIRSILKNSTVNYITKQNVEYLIEVKKTDKKVPKDWVQINTTKAAGRYHTPYVREQTKILAQRNEQLEIEIAAAWESFLRTFSDDYVKFRRAVSNLSVIDCLFAFSKVSRSQGYVKPEIITSDTHQLQIVEGRNPIVEQLIQDPYIPNSTMLSQKTERVMIITGPNMGGKSSYMRQVGLIVIMAQVGCFVPAESCALTPFDAIFTRMGAFDHIHSGKSTFFVELQEASAILKQATRKSLIIMDELGRGTSTMDGESLAAATLKYLIERVGCFTLFVTHYWLLSSLEREYPSEVRNYHMTYLENDDEEDTNSPFNNSHQNNNNNNNNNNNTDNQLQTGSGGCTITFLYKLARGAATRSFGLNVAKLAGIPDSVLRIASEKSAELEQIINERVVHSLKPTVRSIFSEIQRLLEDNNPNQPHIQVPQLSNLSKLHRQLQVGFEE